MNLSQIRQEAIQRIQGDKSNFSKLILVHTAITAGISVLLGLVSYASQYIATEGGLGNMGTQTLLATAQTLLQLLSSLALPFWNASLIFCSLEYLHKRPTTTPMLTEGFRRWGAIGSSLLVRGFIYFAVAMGSSLLSSVFVSMLPLPPALLDELTAFLESPSLPLSDTVQLFYMLYLALFITVFLIMLIPKLYLHRLVCYRIMDKDSCGGLQAVLHSRFLMKGKRCKLFLLDLSFWWFYLLEIGINFLSLGTIFLEQFQITLPINAEIASFAFVIVSMLLRMILYYYAKPRMMVTYAVFYEYLAAESQQEPSPPKPMKMPWKY